jgi:hypothetical protein
MQRRENIRSMLFAVLFCAVCSAAVETLAGNITVTNIETRIIKPFPRGDVLFAIKCNVKNSENTEQKTVVKLQAVDEEGFELTSIYLPVKLKAGESKTVSERSSMPETDFAKAKWGVKD